MHLGRKRDTNLITTTFILLSEVESIHRRIAFYKAYIPCEGMRVADIYYITDTSENVLITSVLKQFMSIPHYSLYNRHFLLHFPIPT